MGGSPVEVWLCVTVAFLLIAFGGLMAAVDAAITATSRADLVRIATGARAQKSLLAIAADRGPHLNAIGFIRITAETTAAVLVTLVFLVTVENLWLVVIFSALIMSAVSFVLVGASPRSVGRAHAATLLRLTAPLAHFVRVVLGPLARALVLLGNWVTPGRTRIDGVASEQQLLSIVDDAAERDVLEEEDRELIHSIFEFNTTVVREVMVPRTDMVTVTDSAHLTSAMALFLSSGASRIPVIAGDVDNVVGVLYLRDLARLSFERPLDTERITVSQLARPANFVPESMKADILLRQMQAESNHLAMVIDEYGGVAGLVTMEDLIEELVGEIADEYDRALTPIEDLGNGRYRVSARLAIDELGELYGFDLDDDDVDSVGGLLAKLLGRLPEVGDRVKTHGLVIEAERSDGRRHRIATALVVKDAAYDVKGFRHD